MMAGLAAMVQVLLGSSLLGTPPAERSAGGATLVEQPITSSVAPVYLDGSDWSLQLSSSC